VKVKIIVESGALTVEEVREIVGPAIVTDQEADSESGWLELTVLGVEAERG
jgi:hypothetical protein